MLEPISFNHNRFWPRIFKVMHEAEFILNQSVSQANTISELIFAKLGVSYWQWMTPNNPWDSQRGEYQTYLNTMNKHQFAYLMAKLVPIASQHPHFISSTRIISDKLLLEPTCQNFLSSSYLRNKTEQAYAKSLQSLPLSISGILLFTIKTK